MDRIKKQKISEKLLEKITSNENNPFYNKVFTKNEQALLKDRLSLDFPNEEEFLETLSEFVSRFSTLMSLKSKEDDLPEILFNIHSQIWTNFKENFREPFENLEKSGFVLSCFWSKVLHKYIFKKLEKREILLDRELSSEEILDSVKNFIDDLKQRIDCQVLLPKKFSKFLFEKTYSSFPKNQFSVNLILNDLLN